MTVDVVLPYFGDPNLLRRAVHSVLTQDDADWRLTIVNDGYPDESLAPWFAALRDERVRYLRNGVRLGAQANNRYCLSLVEHEFFVVMGADDLMLPHYFDTVRALHYRYPDAAVVQPGVEIIDDDDRPVRPLADMVKSWLTPRGPGPRAVRGEALAASLLRGNWLYNPSLCWRTSTLAPIALPASTDVFDLALPLEVIIAGGTVVVDDTVCFRYRRHRTSDSSSGASAGRRFPEEKRFFTAVAATLDARGWPRAAAAARAHLTSRLNAAVQLPGAVARRDVGAARVLGRHLILP